MKSLHSLLLLLLASVLIACSPSRQAGGSTPFTDTLYKPTYASGFEILGAPQQKSTLLRIKSPWQGEAAKPFELLILRENEVAPVEFDGVVLEREPRRIVCFSSSHVALFDALGEVERIVGVSGLRFIHNATLRNHLEQALEVGYDGNVNYEALLSLDADLVLLYGVNGSCAMEPKLRELKLPYLYIGEYLEEDPLGKSEWLVLFGELINQREEAIRCFAPIPERYNALKALTQEAQTATPKVMLNTPYGDSWFMASASSYMARLISDAGGEYLYGRNTANRSLPIDMEEAMLLALEADIWINAGDATSLEEFLRAMPKFRELPCVRSGKVCNCNLRLNPAGGNDFWESGIVRPDLVLRDLIKLFHPELIHEELYYYRILE